MPRVRQLTLLFTCFWVLTSAAFGGPLRFTGKTIETGTVPPLDSTQVERHAKLSDDITVVVQFSRAIRPSDVQALQNAGATIHQYLPDNAYLVTAPIAAVDRLKSVAGATWVGLLPDDAKLSLELEDAHAKASATKAASTAVSYVVLSTDATAVKQLEGKGFQIVASREMPTGWHRTEVIAPLAKAVDISAINSVFRVERKPENELHGERAVQSAAGNLNVGGSAPLGPGYLAWLSAEGLTGGQGMIVQLQDDGLDKGIATNLAGTAHADLLGRIAGIFNATSDAAGDSRAGHGQINAGIIIGNAALGSVDSAGYKLGLGIAPSASVYATKIFRNNGAYDTGALSLTDLARQAQNAGALFSNNSWGASVDGEYTADSAEFDALTRDADPSESGNQPMIYFFSTGNDGPGNGTIGSPATAKNVISVGAVENSDANGSDGCGVGSADSNNNHHLATFSSRGPTLDNRFGVTVVTVGTHVTGPASTVAGYDGTGVCDQYWPNGQTNYARSSGTSHSTPLACGAGMLVYELFNRRLASQGFPANPSPALVRAVLANTATNLAGGDDGGGGTLGHIPNNKVGWGAVNLETLMAMQHALFAFDQQHTFTSGGQEIEFALRPVDPSKPLKLTLTWTDAPAAPGTAINLVNDLDLEVVDGAATYRGNVFSNGFSTTGGSADRRNTIEAVYLASPTGNVVTVRVKAANIVADGVPNFGGALDQDFALFAHNATDQSETGIIHLSPPAVSCDDTLTVTVSDEGLRGSGFIDIQATSTTGDVETLTLDETDADSGVFTGVVNTRTGAPALNGELEVNHGGSVTVEYSDAVNDQGQPAVAQDTSTVDCEPPVVSNVQVTDISSTHATITFTTSEPAVGAVNYGPSCNALSQTRQGGESTTTHTAQLAGLTPTTAYFFKISARDVAGNEVVIGNGGGCFAFNTSARPDFFTEAFPTGNNDLNNQSLFFTPDGSISHYAVCRGVEFLFPTIPTAGTTLNLSDDSFVAVNLSGGATVPFYGQNYSRLYVGSNGYITFASGSEEYAESLEEHFAQPRISVLFDDLVPDGNHPVKFQQLADRVAITWVNVPEFGTSDINNAQVELFFDGRIRITHLQVDSADGVVGLSRGGGVPADFLPSDLTAYASCGASYTIAGTVTVGGNPLAGVTLSGLPGNPVTDAGGRYTASVPGGFSAVVTPQMTGYTFDPASRTYTNVGSSLAAENYTATQAELRLSPVTRSIGPAATTLDFAVENIGSGAMTWSAALLGSPSWASIQSGANGSGNGVVRVAVQTNAAAASRSVVLRVTAPGAMGSPADATITQAAAPSLAVTPSARNVGNGENVTSFTVSNAGGGSMNWTAQVISGGSWLSIPSGQSGTDTGVVVASFLRNSGAQRTGTIRISAPGAVNPSVDVTVTQAQGPTIAVAPAQRTVGYAAGETTFDVSVANGSGVSWTTQVINGEAWLAIVSGASGTDAGTITASLAANTGNQRTATIRLTATGAFNSTVDVTVTQYAAPDLVVTPLRRTVSAEAGSTTFDVSFLGGSDIAWSAQVLSGDWISIASASSGVGAAQLAVAFNANTGDVQRTATIRFSADGVRNGPIDVTVTQAAAAAPASIAVTTPNGGESFAAGDKMEIRWNSQGVTGTVRVELYRLGVRVVTIKSGTKNDGRATWRIPTGTLRSGGYQVKVTSKADASVFDMSDTAFKIQ